MAAAAVGSLRKYSDFFETLYDEQSPRAVGDLRISSHVSILRAEIELPPQSPFYWIFAVIWDDDHDERIIDVLEQFHRKKILHHYVAYAEHKGVFNAILPENIKRSPQYELTEVEPEREYDYWCAEVYTYEAFVCGLAKTAIYTQHITSHHRLGMQQKELPKVPQQDPKVEQLEKQAGSLVVDDIVAYKRDGFKTTFTKDDHKVSIYRFFNTDHAQQQEVRWEQKAIEKFFRIGKPLKERAIGAYAMDILIRRQLSETKQNTYISLDNMLRRAVIISLSKIMAEKGGMPNMYFMLGNTKIHLRSNTESTKRQAGNFEMYIPDLGEYQIKYGAGLITRLKNILVPYSDKDSVDMQKYSFDQLCIWLSSNMVRFKDIPDFLIAPKDKKQGRDTLNGLLFLITVVEVLVRLQRQQDGKLYDYVKDGDKAQRSDSLPVALGQARGLLLLLSGKITFTDFVGESPDPLGGEEHRACYGMVTGTKTIDHLDVVRGKLLKINDKYNSTAKKKPEIQTACAKLEAKILHGHTIFGRSHMYLELSKIYGVGDESSTDSSDYSDSEGEPIAQSIFGGGGAAGSASSAVADAALHEVLKKAEEGREKADVEGKGKKPVEASIQAASSAAAAAAASRP